jgi:hypothetical protein
MNTEKTTVGPVLKNFTERSLRLLQLCETSGDFKSTLGQVFREAMDAIKQLENKNEKVIADVRIMTTAMQNLLGTEEGEREEVEDEDGVCMILTEDEAICRFVDTCIAVMKRAKGDVGQSIAL